MKFGCRCSVPACVCQADVELTEDEQNEIILARILGEAIDSDFVSMKTCSKCAEGWHLTNPMGGQRTFVEPKDA